MEDSFQFRSSRAKLHQRCTLIPDDDVTMMTNDDDDATTMTQKTEMSSEFGNENSDDKDNMQGNLMMMMSVDAGSLCISF